MAGPEFRWIRHRVSVPVGSPVLALARVASRLATPEARALTADLVIAEIDLPDLSPWPTPLAKADVLLQKAAQVEHALMLQYLYAHYSLKRPAEATDQDQKASLTVWRRLLPQIAREEMAHLMVVQNLRLFLGLRPTFERDDFPIPDTLYPFKMRLQPLSQATLATYVVAEAPLEPAGVPNFPDIVAQATGATGMPINHVGVLYALLGVVFAADVQDVEHGASQGDVWYEMVRQIAYLAYGQQAPSDTWHLPPASLHPDSQEQQASGTVWIPPNNLGMRIHLIASRSTAKEALRDIGVQGEGLAPDLDMMKSHFGRFLGIYVGNPGPLPFPAADTWPTHDVPTDPRVSDDTSDPNAITDPVTQDWATLADLRYALLLGFLEQYFLTSPADRAFLRDFSVSDDDGPGEMLHLRTLANKLVTLDRSPGRGKAALPFKLPDPIHLPDQPAQQWPIHIGRMTAAIALEERMLQSHGAGVAALEQMLAQDRLKLEKLTQMVSARTAASGP